MYKHDFGINGIMVMRSMCLYCEKRVKSKNVSLACLLLGVPTDFCTLRIHGSNKPLAQMTTWLGCFESYTNGKSMNPSTIV